MLTDDELNEIARSFLGDAPLQVLLVDRDYRIAYLSRLEQGFSAESVIGRPVDAHIPETHRTVVRAAVGRALDRGERETYETEVATPGGVAHYRTWVGPVRIDGEIRFASMMSSDVTAEVEARRALVREQVAQQQSEARFRLLVDHAPDAIVVCDADTGHFVDVNPKAEELFGLSREELLERGPADVSPETQPDGTPTIEACRRLMAVEDSQQFEWTHRSATGELFECEVRLIPLPHPERRWLRGSITDISARKAAERENQLLTGQLAHAQKLQAVGQLTGGLAHDFNNLLTVIGSSISMIELDVGDPARVKSHAQAVRTAADRAAELTQRLLAFSRQVPLQPRSVNVGELVGEMQSLLSRTLGAQVAIDIAVSDDLWPCEVDPAQLENALLNLAINARDAMPKGGRLRLAVCNRSLSREDGLDDDLPPGDYVELTVDDEGEGIPIELLSKVVEPFFTTKEVGEGSGLGLSMVYGFAKQSRGQLDIESVVGDGTRVRLLLPRSGNAADAASVRPPESAGALGSGEVVLVVEDEPLLRKIVGNLLRRLGFVALLAGDGPEAMALFEAHPEIDLLLSDMVLPGGMNGAQIAQRIRAVRPDLPVLFMSGYTADVAMSEGRLDEGVQLLQKPFTIAMLSDALRETLDQSSIA